MDIFSVPIEVVDANVLPYLEWNDLLRLRRVCKWTKAITDGYLKVHPELAPEIEITEKEEGRGLGAFVEMGIPTTRIFLNNTSGDQFYEDAGEDADIFLEEYGPHVRFLRLDQISSSIIGKEREFLDGLINLKSLEADRYGGYRRGLTAEEAGEALVEKISRAMKDPSILQDWEGKMLFPKIFTGRLKALKIGNNDDFDSTNHVLDFNEWILSNGQALESISLPFNPNATPDPDSTFYEYRDSPLGVSFTYLWYIMTWRSEQNPVAHLKEIDFLSHHFRVEQSWNQFVIDWNASKYFLGFCKLCVTHGVKLRTVGSSWFVGRATTAVDPEWKSPDVGSPVCSLVNMHPSVVTLDMPNLERIDIKSTARSSAGTEWRRNGRPDWPSLRTLDITVDSMRSEYSEWSEQRQMPIVYSTRTIELFDFFFVDISRTSLTELRLEFSGETGTVAIPNTDNIVASCPNLKKLTLVNWLGTNKSLTKLWGGLPGLEEVSLENCKALGNVAFVGEDVRAPVFLKLKKLRKLSLKGLDGMPKITDTLFSLVIRHLELTHLTLTSETPLKSVTDIGVRFLLDGKFGGSIQKFPFKHCSLANVSALEFEKLEAEFRSSKML